MKNNGVIYVKVHIVHNIVDEESAIMTALLI